MARKNEGSGLLARFGTPERIRQEIERLQAAGHTSVRGLAGALDASASSVNHWLRKFAAGEKATRPLSPAFIPVSFVCSECEIHTEATMPSYVAPIALAAWQRVHEGDGQCRVGGNDNLNAYMERWR